MRFKAPLSLLLCLGLAACQGLEATSQGSGGYGGGIVGGTEVSAGDSEGRPVVLLLNQDSGELCTGTLIDARTVLTAAHCAIVRRTGEDPLEDAFSAVSPDNLKVAFGPSPFQSENAETRNVQGLKLHEKYGHGEGTDRYDIAVLRLDQEAPAGTSFAALPDDSKSLVSRNFLALGYGRLQGRSTQDDSANAGDGVLRKTTLTVQSLSAHQGAFVADQRAGQGVCFGDSGGPALSATGSGWAVIGVASGVEGGGSGENDDLCLQTSLYMNVAAFKAWILEAAQALKSAHE